MQPAPDITLPLWFSEYAWADGHGYKVWTSHAPQGFDGYQTKQSDVGQSGLWVWPVGGGKYAPGTAGFTFRAPGTTRIARADLEISYRQNLYASHCTSIGLRVVQETRASDYRCVVPESDQIDVAKDSSVASRSIKLWDPSGAPTSKELFVDIVIPECDKPAPACDKNVPALDPLKNGPFLRVRHVDMTLVDDDLPVVKPSGAFYELDGEYIDGKQTYPLSIAVTDAGAGLTHTQFDHTDPYGVKAALNESNPVCDPTHYTASLESRICPPTDGIETIVDTRPMPEGTNRFRAWSRDLAANVGDSGWTVIVDRTPPPAPPNIRFLTPDEGSGQVAWDASVDPVLADGTPGSGTTTYRFRSRAGGGAWSEWKEIPALRQISDENFDHPAGTFVEFETVAVDLVGNISAPSNAGQLVYGASPSLTLDGPAAHADGSYVGGNEQLDMIATATDVLTSGLTSITVDAVGVGSIGSANATCVNGIHPYAPGKLDCPSSFAATFSVNTAALPEGSRTVNVAATDRAHNTVADTMTFLVDRTPPPQPGPFEIAFDSELSEAQVSWEQADDLNLADGTPGSDVSHSMYRYKVDSGDWSAWTTSEDTEFDTSAQNQDLIRIEA